MRCGAILGTAALLQTLRTASSSPSSPEPPRPMSPLADVRRRRLETVTFLALVVLTTAVFAWMIRHFLMPVFWAAVFAVLFQRVHAWLLNVGHGRRNLAAAVATLTVVLFVVLPFAAVLGALARQGLLLYQAIASGEINVQGPCGRGVAV